MTFKNNSEHIVSFTFKPIGATVSGNSCPHRLTFTYLSFDSQTYGICRVKKIVNDIESFFASRIIDSANIHQEIEMIVLFEEHHQRRNNFFRNFDDVITYSVTKFK